MCPDFEEIEQLLFLFRRTFLEAMGVPPGSDLKGRVNSKSAARARKEETAETFWSNPTLLFRK